MWTPTEAQVVAKLDPEADHAQEAEARARAAVVLVNHWLDGPRDPMLLDAAQDMITIAAWWQSE